MVSAKPSGLAFLRSKKAERERVEELKDSPHSFSFSCSFSFRTGLILVVLTKSPAYRPAWYKTGIEDEKKSTTLFDAYSPNVL